LVAVYLEVGFVALVSVAVLAPDETAAGVVVSVVLVLVDLA
jgi:hypothetical protein